MGDMLYDEDIGSKVTQLAGSFRGLTLVGDPGKGTLDRLMLDTFKRNYVTNLFSDLLDADMNKILE